MRLDKFLKIARFIKRRTIAKEFCDKGRVVVNQKTAKAGTIIHVGDEVQIRFGNNKMVHFKVEKVEENVKKEDTAALYTLL